MYQMSLVEREKLGIYSSAWMEMLKHNLKVVPLSQSYSLEWIAYRYHTWYWLGRQDYMYACHWVQNKQTLKGTYLLVKTQSPCMAIPK